MASPRRRRRGASPWRTSTTTSSRRRVLGEPSSRPRGPRSTRRRPRRPRRRRRARPARRPRAAAAVAAARGRGRARRRRGVEKTVGAPAVYGFTPPRVALTAASSTYCSTLACPSDHATLMELYAIGPNLPASTTSRAPSTAATHLVEGGFCCSARAAGDDGRACSQSLSWSHGAPVSVQNDAGIQYLANWSMPKPSEPVPVPFT